ncbi:leucine-rich repeat-containing protein 49 [Paragonimus westermani]|uniref:Leucine-rich repeat-containing protein 49 n=1 Tax=Paragonimus westermani TaxID=34504 RepID=A0A5J4NQ51_9TREM|nr:leucine-rich repeat-containing protein 49 [Paragonimus westermani]
MENLVFLDLSNNQLNSICGLNDLVSLRVLLLPRNHIRRIQGLDQLLKLEVLDLHQNHIRRIENLAHLTKLRLLNLASNKIVFINGLSGMQSLTELNLRHNQIVQIEPMFNLPSLVWIFLSTNQIERWSQISGLAGLSAKAQVTLDGNPIVLDPMYRRIVPTTSALQSEQIDSQNERVRSATAGSPFRRKQNLHRGDYGPITVNTSSFEKVPFSTSRLSPALSGIRSPNGEPYKHDSNRGSTSVTEILLQSHLTDMKPHIGSGFAKVGELFSIRMEPEDDMRFKGDSTVFTSPLTYSDIAPVKSSDTSLPLFKDVRTMTKNSFLISKPVPHRRLRVKWYIKDRTHLYLTGEPVVADTQSAESIIDMLQNLKTALTDLVNARPFERSIPGGPVPVRGSHLNHITSLTVTGLNWSDLIVELARIRILLPEMKVSPVYFLNLASRALRFS